MAKEFDNKNMWAAKTDNRWWHIEEYLTGRKALIIGKRIQLVWYSIEKTRFSVRCFSSINMYYIHFIFFGKVMEFYYHKRV